LSARAWTSTWVNKSETLRPRRSTRSSQSPSGSTRARARASSRTISAPFSRASSN
jgi:hypothetical protein